MSTPIHSRIGFALGFDKPPHIRKPPVVGMKMASLTSKSLLCRRFLAFRSTSSPISHFPKSHPVSLKPVQLTPLCSFSVRRTSGASLKDSLWQSKFGRFSSSAVSVGGGSGGFGGYGNSGGRGKGEGGGGGGGGNGGENSSFLSWYMNLLAKYPVLTKAVTSALLTFIGDLICQLAIDQVPSLDVKRTFLFTFLGLVLVGPTLHFWYLYLSKLVVVPGALGAFLRLLLDQFFFAPCFIGVFLSVLVTLEGRPEQVVLKLQQEWFSAVVANWQLWIPFQFLNFRFVPQQFQVLAANAIALVWNVILSFKAHKEVLAK